MEKTTDMNYLIQDIFFVEKFIDLTKILNMNKLPETSEIAKMLSNKTWE